MAEATAIVLGSCDGPVMGLLSCLLDFSSQPQIFVAVGLGELWAGVIVETHNWSN